MADALLNPAEEPRILPAQTPAWLKPSTLLPIVALLCAGTAILLWQISKSDKARTESNLLLATQPGAATWATLIQKYPGQPATALALLESAAEATTQKDPRKSAGFYEQFLRDFPKHPIASAARFAQANQLAASGDSSLAQTLYLRILTDRPLDPFRTGAALGLARLQIQENRPEAARQVLNDILAANTGSAFLPDARALLETLPPAPSFSKPTPAPAPAPQPPAK